MLVVLIIGTLATLTTPFLQEARNRAMVARATTEVRNIATEIDMYVISSSVREPPSSLADIGWANMTDPWGRPYVYFKFVNPKAHGHPAGARKDRFLVPVNSTYDLYSLGRDGQSTAAFTASKSRDDIVRANDGGFFGLAEDF
jgi:general secretion pathway protein G